MMIQTTPKASTFSFVLTKDFNKPSSAPNTGLVAFGAVDASLKIKSKNGINIPRETIENIMERRINRQYQKTSPLY